ncbi:MAG: hypothetical protein KDD11_22445 [Acidobacteria bacterium]|nr:hypothetical protein [Acidobacteriota bacterium]
MKRILLGALVLACTLASTPQLLASETQNLRFTVMVSKFENQTPFQGQLDLGNSWRTIMTGALGKNPHFIVVSESDMRQEAIKTQTFDASGVTTQGHTTSQRGNLTPAQLLVKGTITHYETKKGNNKGIWKSHNVEIGGTQEGSEIKATVQLIDASTGTVIVANNFTGKSKKRGVGITFRKNQTEGDLSTERNDSVSQAMIDAIDQTIAWMVTKLPSIPWRGEIMLIDGDTFVVNRGTREGVETGEIFVAGPIKILRDPDTGELLDVHVDEQARLRVDRVREKVSYCSVVAGDASLIQETMGVTRTSL